MKGIVLMSHGPLAKGMYETTKWFMGEEIEQYDYLCLQPTDLIEEFDDKIRETIERVDTGEGVIVFADLFGGTPCNRVLQFMNDKVDVIAGMNLTLVLEQLGNRLSDIYDVYTLVETGKNGVVHVNSFNLSNDDDFLD